MALTCREAVPDLQVVVAADGARRRRDVGLHVEAVELHHDLRHLGGVDHEGAVQVVGILLGEARGLDDAPGGREVPGTFWTCGQRRSGQDQDQRDSGLERARSSSSPGSHFFVHKFSLQRKK